MEILHILLIITATHAFYKIPLNSPFKFVSNIVVPQTNEELKNALCSRFDNYSHCIDYDFKVILITKIFDYTGTEGTKTQDGCYHISTPYCKIYGQKNLNLFNQCNGLEPVMVTYDKAGINPLMVGSNKYIVSRGGGIKGKGLKAINNHDILIDGLSITDINPAVIFGGDAISLDNVTNVWINGNYFCRVGRQMIVTGYNACQQVTISNNHFDGNTNTSAYCDTYHYWLWLFEGSNDTVTIYNNYVNHFAGRGPHIAGLRNASAIVHIINNKFEDITHAGLLELYKSPSKVLIEGNTYTNVSLIVSLDEAQIYYPFSSRDANRCIEYINRKCHLNKVTNSFGLNFKSEISVLEEFSNFDLSDTNQINKYNKLFGLYKNKL